MWGLLWNLLTACSTGVAANYDIDVTTTSKADHCYFKVVSDHYKNEEQTLRVQLPEQCDKGDVHWTHPRGYLHLSVEATDPNDPFQLCIGEAWITSVVELTGGLKVPKPLPSLEKQTCTRGQNGAAELRVKADPSLFYYSVFSYYVKFDKNNIPQVFN